MTESHRDSRPSFGEAGMREPYSKLLRISACHHQLALDHALQSLQLVRNALKSRRWAAQDDYFETYIVRKMDVGCGDDQVGVVMLEFGESFSELSAVVVID